MVEAAPPSKRSVTAVPDQVNLKLAAIASNRPDRSDPHRSRRSGVLIWRGLSSDGVRRLFSTHEFS